MILKELPLRLIQEPGREIRSRMVEEKLEGLANSVGEKSQKAPIKCIPDVKEEDGVFDMSEEEFDEWAEDYDGLWEIVHGHRRYKARSREGDENLICILSNENKDGAVMDRVKENVYRQDVNPIDEGRYFKWLRAKYDLTYQEIADRIGRAKSYVSERLTILDYPDDVRKALEWKELDFSKAREIRKIDDDSYRNKILTMTLNGAATTQTVREWVDNYRRKEREIKKRREEARKHEDEVTAEERDRQEQFREQAKKQRKEIRTLCNLHGGKVPRTHVRSLKICDACWKVLSDMQEEIKARVDKMEKDMDDFDVEDEIVIKDRNDAQ